ncbi:MAG: hypothetical protein CUN55_14760 [Phototrophicales bacterium]|nr:MAG: hypothetical protein CUN55_14760 [Phototrophicales bacterium]
MNRNINTMISTVSAVALMLAGIDTSCIADQTNAQCKELYHVRSVPGTCICEYSMGSIWSYTCNDYGGKNLESYTYCGQAEVGQRGYRNCDNWSVPIGYTFQCEANLDTGAWVVCLLGELLAIGTCVSVLTALSAGTATIGAALACLGSAGVAILACAPCNYLQCKEVNKVPYIATVKKTISATYDCPQEG